MPDVGASGGLNRPRLGSGSAQLASWREPGCTVSLDRWRSSPVSRLLLQRQLPRRGGRHWRPGRWAGAEEGVARRLVVVGLMPARRKRRGGRAGAAGLSQRGAPRGSGWRGPVFEVCSFEHGEAMMRSGACRLMSSCVVVRSARLRHQAVAIARAAWRGVRNSSQWPGAGAALRAIQEMAIWSYSAQAVRRVGSSILKLAGVFVEGFCHSLRSPKARRLSLLAACRAACR